MSGRRYWTRYAMREALRQRAQELGRPPKVSDMRVATDATPAYITYVREYGTWREALADAGFTGVGGRGRRKAAVAA